MSPADLDLDMYQGDTFTRDFTFTTNGVTPINLTGYTLTAQFRVTVEDSSSTAFTCVLTNAAAGQARISMTAAQTQALAQFGVWDLQWVTNLGDTQTVLRGTVTVTREVTR